MCIFSALQGVPKNIDSSETNTFFIRIIVYSIIIIVPIKECLKKLKITKNMYISCIEINVKN